VVETPPEAEAGWVRTRFLLRSRLRPSSEAEIEAEPWGRARQRPPSEVEVEDEP
jgi:hypothetical protein